MNRIDGADLLASLLADDPTAFTETAPAVRVKFTVTRQVFKTLLDKAATVVPTGDVMPVLKCVQLDVSPQRLRVVASDTQLSLITATSTVSVTQPGVVVFPARKLHDIVKSADGDEVHLRVTGTSGHVRVGRASWTLRLQGGDDYPPMPAIDEAEFTAVERTTFLNAVQTVRYAASRDPAAYTLAMIDINDGRFTATDGPRTQQATIADFPVTLRLPINAVDEILRLLKLADADTLHVGQSDTRIILRCGGDLLIINKTVAAFPDLQAVLMRPALENRHRLWIPCAALLAAVRHVRINADPDTSAIALHLAGNAVTVQARDKHGNTAEETVTAEWAEPARTLIVNHRHLVDLLNAHPAADVVLHLGDDTKTRRTPVLIRHDDGTRGVLQQMNLDWSTS